jgi:hypothetical protein
MAEAQTVTTVEQNGKPERTRAKKPEGIVRIVVDLTEAQMVQVKREQCRQYEKQGYRGDMPSVAEVLVGYLPKNQK